MLPTQHPLTKTAIDLRRSHNRLMIYRAQNPDDPYVINGTIDSLLHDLREAKKHIPEELAVADEN